MTRSPSTARHRTGVALTVAAVCGLAAVGFGLMTAGIGMPRLPADGIRLTAPDSIVVTDDEGRSVTLLRGEGPSARIKGEVVHLDAVDTESHVGHDVPVDTEPSRPTPGGPPSRSLTVRGAGVDAEGEMVEIRDPYVLYFLGEGDGVLSETTDPYGHRTAAQDTTDVIVQTDDPAVSRIFPAYNQNVRSETGDEERVPAWDIEFDLAAAHAEGRTNLPLPLSWYASPLAHGLDAAAPWLLGGSIAVGAAALVVARRAHRSRDDGLLRT